MLTHLTLAYVVAVASAGDNDDLLSMSDSLSMLGSGDGLDDITGGLEEVVDGFDEKLDGAFDHIQHAQDALDGLNVTVALKDILAMSADEILTMAQSTLSAAEAAADNHGCTRRARRETSLVGLAGNIDAASVLDSVMAVANAGKESVCESLLAAVTTAQEGVTAAISNAESSAATFTATVTVLVAGIAMLF
eukprot:gene10499-16348_t